MSGTNLDAFAYGCKAKFTSPSLNRVADNWAVLCNDAHLYFNSRDKRCTMYGCSQMLTFCPFCIF